MSTTWMKSVRVIVAMAAMLSFDAGVFAQLPAVKCPPGQTPMHAVDSDGKVISGCTKHSNRIVHDAPVRGYIPTCKQDSDCPAGVTRCQNGSCGRTNTTCEADSDCKFSEFCDASQHRCKDKGGQY